jgi:hypothetical protein
MALDDNGNIWLINRESMVNKPLLMVPADFMIEHSDAVNWLEFTTADIGAANSYFDYLTFDQQGRLWLGGNGAPAQGVRCFDFNASPYDKTDDVDFLFDLDNGLLNNSINDLAIDQDNCLWVVSSGGVNYLDIPEEIISQLNINFDINYDLYGKIINCVMVDPMNNKWFGTEQEGVIVLSSDNYTILYVYDEENAPLLDNRILSLAFNASSGQAYIGTPQGISVVQTPYREFGQTLGSLQMGPIPFYPDLGENLTFSSQSLTPGAVVKFFTSNGLLVRKLSFTQASLGWDGRDEKGRLVGSGVYLVLVTTPNAEAISGKLPVIRK